jgi:hypothetical protein
MAMPRQAKPKKDEAKAGLRNTKAMHGQGKAKGRHSKANDKTRQMQRQTKFEHTEN